MAILKFKDENNQWQDLVAIRGRDGVIQYQAGNGIVIDGNVISAIQQDLSNYYTKAQVNDLIDAIDKVSLEPVNELPATGEPNVIYLVPSTNPQTTNAKDEYIYINNAWEQIGSTAVDLSNYYTKSEVDEKFYESNGIYTIRGTLGTSLFKSGNNYRLTLSNQLAQKIWDIYDDALAKNYMSVVIEICDTGKNNYAILPKITLAGWLSDASVTAWNTLQSISPVESIASYGGAWANNLFRVVPTLNSTIDETGKHIASTSTYSNQLTFSPVNSLTNYLSKTNSTTYTPTSDYHPATKKYVDDKIPGVATTSTNGLMSAADKASLNDLVTAVGSVSSTDVTNWNAAATNSHTHANKSLLDTITSGDVSDWNDAVTNSHTHSNKTVLDGITAANITAWNKTHIYSGTSTPGAGTGENGDIYVKYTA